MLGILRVVIGSLSVLPIGLALELFPAKVLASQRAFPEITRSPSVNLAQATNCRQVVSGISGLNVRENPSVESDVIGYIVPGRSVIIESLGTEGWAPISAPVEGFVSTRYLTLCDRSANVTPTANAGAIADNTCREVGVRSGLNVRAEPSRYSNRITALAGGTRVQISETATENWVMITAPIEGYVARRFLEPCDY